MTRTEKLKTALKYWYEGKGYNRAIKAMHLAQNLHMGTRKDGVTPEIFHQISVAGYLKTISDGVIDPENIQIVAWLHDAEEDEREAFRSRLDDAMPWLGVSCLTEIQNLNKSGWDTEVYYDTLSYSPIASIVKGADRIHNHQTMNGVFTQEKKEAYIKETKLYVLPMLKEARMNFPEQTNAYYNIIHVLRTQIELITGETP